jgi:hypothetical protein
MLKPLNMWNKIYLVALAVAVLGIGALGFLSYKWLHSISKPTDVVENYQYYANLYWTFLFISSLVLLILANVLLWLRRRAWALWTTFAYFAFFILLQTWWLNRVFLDFQITNNLTESTFSFLGLGATFLCIVVAVGIFFNQFLVLRMRDRIHGIDNPTNDILPAENVPSEEL